MDRFNKWAALDVPASWAALVVRGVIATLVGFVILQAKEFVDAGRFDTPATFTDALMIAGGIVLVNAILLLASARTARREPLPRH